VDGWGRDSGGDVLRLVPAAFSDGWLKVWEIVDGREILAKDFRAQLAEVADIRVPEIVTEGWKFPAPSFETAPKGTISPPRAGSTKPQS
jgi:hypothetical protein